MKIHISKKEWFWTIFLTIVFVLGVAFSVIAADVIVDDGSGPGTWVPGDATNGMDVDVTRISGTALTAICNSAAGDWIYAPTAGKYFEVYAWHFSIDADCGDGTVVDLECNGGTVFDKTEEPKQGGKYHGSVKGNFIQCGTDVALGIDTCDSNNVSACFYVREVTP